MKEEIFSFNELEEMGMIGEDHEDYDDFSDENEGLDYDEDMDEEY